MSEVEQICERVGILRKGRLIAVDTISSLKARQLRHVDVRFDRRDVGAAGGLLRWHRRRERPLPDGD